MDEKIIQLEALSLLNTNSSKEYQELVIKVYFYFLYEYDKFVSKIEVESMLDSSITNDFSNTNNAQIELNKLLSNFLLSVEGVNNGGIPDKLLDLSKNCSQQLSIMEVEFGKTNDVYLKASKKTIETITNHLNLWVKECSAVMHTPIEGLRNGNTLYDTCVLIIKELDKINTDDKTKSQFNSFKVPFLEANKPQSSSACYIATFTYGNINHPKVQLYRDFRDNYLAKSIIGRLFIDQYYYLSPFLVKYFIQIPIAQRVSRYILDLLIKFISRA